MVSLFQATSTLVIIISLLCITATYAIVNPHNFKYLINTNQICNVSDIDIFIWVHSGPANIRRRIALRETWTNQMYMPKDLTVRIVFFMGNIKENSTRQMLLYESEVYGDVVQEDYMDSYRNLTYKAMSGLKWINTHCKNTNIKFLFKTDDDMMVYMDKLTRHLNHLAQFPRQQLNSTIICDVWRNRNVERSGGMKWSITKEEFARDQYPTYCPGLALLMTSDLVKPLWEKALETPYFWVDDVFFTGLIVEHLNITWIQTGSLFHFGGKKLTSQFMEKDSGYIFAHVFPYRNDLFYYLWKQVYPSQDLIH